MVILYDVVCNKARQHNIDSLFGKDLGQLGHRHQDELVRGAAHIVQERELVFRRLFFFVFNLLLSGRALFRLFLGRGGFLLLVSVGKSVRLTRQVKRCNVGIMRNELAVRKRHYGMRAQLNFQLIQHTSSHIYLLEIHFIIGFVPCSLCVSKVIRRLLLLFIHVFVPPPLVARQVLNLRSTRKKW